ncbi:ABC transporter ATP-binding protein [Glaciecola siphonariae]|uniref:ABC transporter ATP-binding protein n=1 Tax=Glaciecola siphonariae TaxID=521012 RepID=A0ABV9LVU5_9ALTE
MISLKNVTKYYPSKLGNQYVFEDLSFDIPSGHNIALLGKNGAGKSTLFRLLACSEYPDKGRIVTDKHISWPVALGTGIHPQMTGRENARFIARVNGVSDVAEYERRVIDFAELGIKYHLPVKTYSSGMRSRLAFACTIAIDFDVYLIDEVTSVGDPQFKRKAQRALYDRSKQSNVIMISHQMPELRLFCDSALLMEKGKLTFYDDVDEAIKRYEAL